MTETQASVIAQCWGGLPWQPLPGLWRVVITHPDGTLVVMSSGGVRQYAHEQDLEDGEPTLSIEFDGED